jgi:hypothetical protein
MEQSVFYRETLFSSAMKYFQEMKHELISQPSHSLRTKLRKL